MKHAVVLLSFAAAALGAVGLQIGTSPEPAPPGPVATAAPVTAAPVTASMPVAPAAPAAPSAGRQAALATYPDGSTMPLLNDVREPLTVQWPANRAFTPIVATVADAHGIAWYRHRDGTWSTMRMLHDSARNLDVATSQVFSPMPQKDHTALLPGR